MWAMLGIRPKLPLGVGIVAEDGDWDGGINTLGKFLLGLHDRFLRVIVRGFCGAGEDTGVFEFFFLDFLSCWGAWVYE